MASTVLQDPLDLLEPQEQREPQDLLGRRDRQGRPDPLALQVPPDRLGLPGIRVPLGPRVRQVQLDRRGPQDLPGQQGLRDPMVWTEMKEQSDRREQRDRPELQEPRGPLAQPVLLAPQDQQGQLGLPEQRVQLDPQVQPIQNVSSRSSQPIRSLTLTTGDGKAYIGISDDLNGLNLIDADAFLVTASAGGGPTTIQIRNVTHAVDMLSTPITIDDNENSSYTAATPPVIDTSNDGVVTADILSIDVDVAGIGAGLIVVLTFGP